MYESWYILERLLYAGSRARRAACCASVLCGKGDPGRECIGPLLLATREASDTDSEARDAARSEDAEDAAEDEDPKLHTSRLSSV